MEFFVITILVAVGYLSIIYFYQRAFHREIQLTHFSFSPFHYYMMMSTFGVALIFQTLLRDNVDIFYLFVFLCFAGVIGETIFSLWWKGFFARRFWVYKVETIFSKYTSLLNLIPWGVGGFLYLVVYDNLNKFLGTSLSNQSVFFSSFVFVMLIFVSIGFRLVFNLILERTITLRFRKFALHRYFYYVLPFVFTIIMFTLFFDPYYLVLAVGFGIIGFLTEYLFGKVCVLFVSRSLWDYTYHTFDNKHGTLLSIVPFSIAGFWFLLSTRIAFLIKDYLVKIDPRMFSYFVFFLGAAMFFVLLYSSGKNLRSLIFHVSKSKGRELFLLFIYLCTVCLVALLFKLNFFVMTILYYSVPVIYFAFRTRKYFKKILIQNLIWSILCSLVIDYIGTASLSWYEPSIFSFRVFGKVSIEILIWGCSYTFLILLIYSYFFDRYKTLKFTKYTNLSFLIIIFLFLVFICEMLFFPQILESTTNWSALVVVGTVIFIYGLKRYPQLIHKIVLASIVLFVIGILNEYVAVHLNNWWFPSEGLQDRLIIAGTSIPLLEYYWWIIFAPFWIWFYEIFGDDRKNDIHIKKTVEIVETNINMQENNIL
jgi:hypothetical protein